MNSSSATSSVNVRNGARAVRIDLADAIERYCRHGASPHARGWPATRRSTGTSSICAGTRPEVPETRTEAVQARRRSTRATVKSQPGTADTTVIPSMQDTDPVTPTKQRIRRLALAVTVGVLGAQLLHAIAGFGNSSLDGFFANDVYTAVELAGVLACGARALLVREHRAAWWCITASFAFWTAGDIIWLTAPDIATHASSADVLYLLFFPLCCAGMALLAAGGHERVAARMWLDGLIAAFAVAALTVALIFGVIVDSAAGTTTQIVVNLAYPIGDVVLIGFVLAVFATQAWRPGRGWLLLGAGAALPPSRMPSSSTRTRWAATPRAAHSTSSGRLRWSAAAGPRGSQGSAASNRSWLRPSDVRRPDGLHAAGAGPARLRPVRVALACGRTAGDRRAHGRDPARGHHFPRERAAAATSRATRR